MFHLLVAYGGWKEGGDSILNSRIYIKRDNPLQQPFLNNDGTLNMHRIREIPALLVAETGSDTQQLARVAYINNIRKGSKDTEIEYAIDNSIHPISNRDLDGFNLSRFSLTHTCWTLNEADLFKGLLLNKQNNALSPSVFSIDPSGQASGELVSVMMPFSAEFNNVYKALQTAVSATGLTCQRADNFWEHPAIIQDIVTLIVRARVLICDCSGRNPNVFYEAGIAHTLGKEVILLTQSENDIPFDLRHLRYIRYLNNSEGLLDLSSKVQERIQTLLRH
jgi:hypothetical protein